MLDADVIIVCTHSFVLEGVCVCVCGSELGNIIMGIGIDTCILYRDDREKRLKDVSKGCGMEMLISVEDCVKAFIY
jgi:hypothetical protein